MLQDPRVRKLSFTGSTEVGRALLKEAADQVLNCSMELGGNAPFIVFEDADIEAALEGAMIAKMRNGGEACTAANRFYVHDGRGEAFADGPRRADGRDAGRAGLRPGDALRADDQRGGGREDRRAGQATPSAAGARVLTGGEPLERDGFYYPPTVHRRRAGGRRDHAARRSSARSPRSPPSTTEAEVIAAANATEYGLVAYVYTGDLARGLRVSERLESGMVGLNRGLISDPAAPFGGVKQSGLGREGGHHGIMEFVRDQVHRRELVAARRSTSARRGWASPGREV